MISFCSTDPLGLTSHSYFRKMSLSYASRWKGGSDYLERYSLIEKKIALLLGAESVSLSEKKQHFFSSLRDVTLFVDRGCNSNLICEAKASGHQVIFYAHNDTEHLRALLRTVANEKWILTDSLFTNLHSLIELDAKLFIDDSMAFSILGYHGLGLAARREGIDVVSLSFNEIGHLLAGPTHLIKHLQSAPLAPVLLGGIDAMFDLIPDLSHRRERLLGLAAKARKKLKQLGFDSARSGGHTLHIQMPSSEEAMHLHSHLKKSEIYTLLQSSEIRINLTADHHHDDLEELLYVLKEWSRPQIVQNLLQPCTI